MIVNFNGSSKFLSQIQTAWGDLPASIWLLEIYGLVSTLHREIMVCAKQFSALLKMDN